MGKPIARAAINTFIVPAAASKVGKTIEAAGQLGEEITPRPIDAPPKSIAGKYPSLTAAPAGRQG